MPRTPHTAPTGRPAFPYVAILVVVVLAFAVYANALSNGFVWDDTILLDRQLVVFDSAAKVLRPPAGIPQFSPDYYRPVVIASYLLDLAVAGRSAFMFHLTVVTAQNIQINLGTIAIQSGDLSTAERHYREALEVVTSADALFSLG